MKEAKHIYESAGLKLNIKLQIKVDYADLAKGVYGMFTQDERVVMAFGMFPHIRMELVEKEFRRKCALIALEYAEIAATDENIEEWSQAVDKDAVKEFNHQLSVAILTEAKAANMLIV